MKKKMKTPRLSSALLGCIALAAFFFGDCAESLPQKHGQSGVEISYFLGHDRHRLTLEALDSHVVARAFLDRQQLEENQVDRARYDDFFKKAFEFTTVAQRNPAHSQQCRNPFTVTVRLGKSTQSASGCRSPEETALSRLVRDGEFLLYSKK